jgi:hypothetical protein
MIGLVLVLSHIGTLKDDSETLPASVIAFLSHSDLTFSPQHSKSWNGQAKIIPITAPLVDAMP